MQITPVKIDIPYSFTIIFEGNLGNVSDRELVNLKVLLDEVFTDDGVLESENMEIDVISYEEIRVKYKKNLNGVMKTRFATRYEPEDSVVEFDRNDNLPIASYLREINKKISDDLYNVKNVPAVKSIICFKGFEEVYR